jgi:TRAP transporter TAXI family solute receptor
VLSGDLQLGLAQSDRQYQAVHGLKEWEGHPQGRLRAICSLHPEVVTLVAAIDSAVDGVPALKGKRVNIGNPGSGQRGNSLDVLAAFGIDPDKDLHAEGLIAAEAPRMLQDGRLDAFFYTVGHPSGNITEATTGTRAVRIVPIGGPGIDALIAEKPFYAPAVIPCKYYPQAGNQDDIQSVGVTATLIASADLDEGVVYRITRALFTHLDELRALHPALAGLTRQSMMLGLSAPLHPGALRYYREAGLRE